MTRVILLMALFVVLALGSGTEEAGAATSPLGGEGGQRDSNEGEITNDRKWFTAQEDDDHQQAILGDSNDASSVAASSKALKPDMIVKLDQSKPSRVLDAGQGFVALLTGEAPFGGDENERVNVTIGVNERKRDNRIIMPHHNSKRISDFSLDP